MFIVPVIIMFSCMIIVTIVVFIIARINTISLIVFTWFISVTTSITTTPATIASLILIYL